MHKGKKTGSGERRRENGGKNKGNGERRIGKEKKGKPIRKMSGYKWKKKRMEVLVRSWTMNRRKKRKKNR